MTTLRLPMPVVKRLASALLPHCSDDMITPALTNVVVGGEMGTFAYSTNRYTIGRYDLTNIMDEPGVTFSIPKDVLTAVSRIGKSTVPVDLGAYEVVFERIEREARQAQMSVRVVLPGDDDEPEETHWMRVWHILPEPEKYPSFAKLYSNLVAEPRDVMLLDPIGLDRFASFSKLTREKMRVHLCELQRGEVGVMLIEIGTRFKGLMMMNQPGSLDNFGQSIVAPAKEKSE